MTSVFPEHFFPDVPWKKFEDTLGTFLNILQLNSSLSLPVAGSFNASN